MTIISYAPISSWAFDFLDSLLMLDSVDRTALVHFIVCVCV